MPPLSPPPQCRSGSYFTTCEAPTFVSSLITIEGKTALRAKVFGDKAEKGEIAATAELDKVDTDAELPYEGTSVVTAAEVGESVFAGEVTVSSVEIEVETEVVK